MALPLSRQDLTDKQIGFIRALVYGGGPRAAAMIAGYADPGRAAWDNTRHPAVRLALHAELTRVLHTEDAPNALSVLRDIMMDAKMHPKIRVDCAKTILDRAGFVGPRGKERGDQPGDKAMNEMSAEELRATIDRLEQELGNRAVTITSTPDTPVVDGQVVDILELL